MNRILKNAVYCRHCNTEVRSYHRHDFQSCKCEEDKKKISVDGGTNYARRLWGKKADYEDRTVEDNGNHETRRNNLCWGVNYTKDKKALPKTKWTLIKDLNTDHIEAILELPRIDDFYKEVFENELKYRNGK